MQQVLGSTILISLMAAIQLPVVLTKLAYLIDNPWSVSLERANAAGLILADSLIDRNLGTRPITFVGYSLGCRMIFSCLQELARRGAYGLVQNVYLFGSPIVVKQDDFLQVRTVVAGRFVNGYANNDWILGYLFRMTSGGISRVAGLAPIENVPGLENVNVTELVPGHMSYRAAMPKLLREVGWLVESDEFTEIEDPDPEDHSKRHRELINEIEEARKDYEAKLKEKEAKGKFGWLQRKKKAVREKKEWEMYQETKDEPERSGADMTSASDGHDSGLLFDIDAIRAELASEQMEVKELKSTLPPMQLKLDPQPASAQSSDAATLWPRAPAQNVRSLTSDSVPKGGHRSVSSPLASMGSKSCTTTPLPEVFARTRTSEDVQISFEAPSPRKPTQLSIAPEGAMPDPFAPGTNDPLRPPPISTSPIHLPGRIASRSPSPISPARNFPSWNGTSSTLPNKLTASDERPGQANAKQDPLLQATSTTTAAHKPVMSSPNMSLEHNAWADDDEDFKSNGGMHMSFA